MLPLKLFSFHAIYSWGTYSRPKHLWIHLNSVCNQANILQGGQGHSVCHKLVQHFLKLDQDDEVCLDMVNLSYTCPKSLMGSTDVYHCLKLNFCSDVCHSSVSFFSCRDVPIDIVVDSFSMIFLKFFYCSFGQHSISSFTRFAILQFCSGLLEIIKGLPKMSQDVSGCGLCNRLNLIAIDNSLKMSLFPFFVITWFHCLKVIASVTCSMYVPY